VAPRFYDDEEMAEFFFGVLTQDTQEFLVYLGDSLPNHAHEDYAVRGLSAQEGKTSVIGVVGQQDSARSQGMRKDFFVWCAGETDFSSILQVMA
jgi:hypothetical protein